MDWINMIDIELIIVFVALSLALGIQTFRLKKVHDSLERTLVLLGYYRLRFGFVPPEDIMAGVGLSENQKAGKALDKDE